MNNPNKNETDEKKRDNERRTEIAMLRLLVEKYPEQAREKLWKQGNESNYKRKTASL